MSKVTLSVIKADVGGFVGHSSVHPDLLNEARGYLSDKGKGLLTDFYVTHVGDDIELVMTHRHASTAKSTNWRGMRSCGHAIAKKLKLYGAGQDL